MNRRNMAPRVDDLRTGDRVYTERRKVARLCAVNVSPCGDRWRVSWQARGMDSAWFFDTEPDARKAAAIIQGWVDE